MSSASSARPIWTRSTCSAPAGIRFISVAHEQGAGHMADGFARATGRARRLHRPERPGHHQLRHRRRRRLLGPFAGRGDHARDRLQHAAAWAASRRPSSCRSSRRSPSTRPTARPGRALPSCSSRCFDYAMLERGPTQFNIPRDLFYGEVDATIPKPIRVERRPAAPSSLDEARRAPGRGASSR